ncbi:sulfatase [Falsirhodobacter halotolerans]|uniref:sulfatase n=1 Tax=Falsirhodobacter halotolerans TaxID=1146892 RepID=UPI001FD4AB5B|nr:sulfatase [Falsirhodobacter halotolerans]MCJ8138254.1 sulfatase [Falsirhodobacter halotolerans]
MRFHTTQARAWWRPLMAAALLGAILAVPARPVWPAAVVPLELPVLLMLALVPVLRPLLLGALILSLLVKLADIGIFAAFHRPADLIADWPLLPAAWQLGAANLGAGRMSVGIAAVLALLIVLALAIRWSVRQRGLGWVAALAAVAALLFPAAADTSRFLAAKATETRAALASRTEFRTAALRDPFDGRAGNLAGLGATDAAIIFVESYGRTSFDTPLYAEHPPILRDIEGRARAAGLAMRSGWLTSPISGGQSWLAQTTLVSGLHVSDQGRYRALLASPRRTLFDLAEAGGRHPVAFAPAITMAWPEAPLLGFREVLAAADMGYRGRPLNWVTMPDQYTLSVVERRLRAPHDRPIFAQVALISSHAPWVPVIDPVPWADVGDGAVFDGAGWDTRTPEEVWANPDTIRAQYAASIAYSLKIVGDFALRQADNPPLLVILGDHQPANFVAQMDNRDVPVHIIGAPELIRRFDGWGWADGMIPDPALPAWPMEAFRDRFLTALGDGP